MARGTTLTSSIGGIASGYWRNNPARYSNTRGVGVRFCHGVSGTGITSTINSDYGRKYGSDRQSCKTVSSQARCISTITHSLWSRPRTLHIWAAQLPTTIATGWPCIRIFGRYGGGGGMVGKLVTNMGAMVRTQGMLCKEIL